MDGRPTEREILWHYVRLHYRHPLVLGLTCLCAAMPLRSVVGVAVAPVLFCLGWQLGTIIAALQRAALWEAQVVYGRALEARGWRRVMDEGDVTAPIGRYWFSINDPWPLMPPWAARAKQLDRELRFNASLPWAIPHRGSLSVWEWLRLVRWCRRAEHRPDVAALEECGGHPAVALLYLAERT